MTPSQDLSRIRDVAGHCIPYGITGYQGDSASNVPLDAELSGLCHDIFKPFLDLCAGVIHEGKP
jgi:hypothetical protein